MPKRSSTDSQADSSPSEVGEIDQKPDLSDSQSEDYKPATSPKKKAKPSSKKKKDDDKPVRHIIESGKHGLADEI